MVVLTAALFGTGIELWLFGFHFGGQWLTWHKAVCGVMARRCLVVANPLVGVG